MKCWFGRSKKKRNQKKKKDFGCQSGIDFNEVLFSVGEFGLYI